MNAPSSGPEAHWRHGAGLNKPISSAIGKLILRTWGKFLGNVDFLDPGDGKPRLAFSPESVARHERTLSAVRLLLNDTPWSLQMTRQGPAPLAQARHLHCQQTVGESL